MLKVIIAVDQPYISHKQMVETLEDPFRAGECAVLETKPLHNSYLDKKYVEERARDLVVELRQSKQLRGALMYIGATTGFIRERGMIGMTPERYDYAHVYHVTGTAYGQPLSVGSIHVPRSELIRGRTPREVIIALKHFVAFQFAFRRKRLMITKASPP